VLREQLSTRKAKILEIASAINADWIYEDLIYRFYHGSFKVFWIQESTVRMVAFLQSLCPEAELDAKFREIVAAGTGLKFEMSHNDRWAEVTRPMVEAFLHAKYFLDMAARYTDATESSMLPSGWAGLLSLYKLR
jgi:hypothetical protein